MGIIVKLVGTGIGLAAEAIKARRSPSPSQPSEPSSSRNIENPPPYEFVEVPEKRAEELIAKGQAVPVDEKVHAPDYDESDSDESAAENDEADWQLDEAAQQHTGPPKILGDSDRQIGVGELVQSFMAEHPPPSYTTATGRLPCPVIIPQRRPHDQSRGFVRAYAPMLADCGISQAAFLHFLKALHQAEKTTPMFNVTNIADSARVADTILKDVQSRPSTKTFLQQMNEKLFQPHGLYCLIMTYKPNPQTSSDFRVRGGRRHRGDSHIEMHGEFELPEAAPLIFPALDEVAAAMGQDPEKQNAFKKSQKFVADYFDRRWQATFNQVKPTSSTLSPGPSEFASRYSDPNHPANNGSLISFLTGGAVNPRARRERRRAQRAERRGKSPRARRTRNKGPVRRMLRQGMLYLMVVNMPTEAELQMARARLATPSASSH